MTCSNIVPNVVPLISKSTMKSPKNVQIAALSIISIHSSATVALILNDQNELLVCRRAKEPAKGTLDLPGGFIDMNETGEEGVAREVLEETGLKVQQAVYQFSLPNIYIYSGFPVHTLDMFFLCTVEDISHFSAMDDVSDSFFLPLSEINPEDFGLDSIRRGLKKFLSDR